MELRMSFFNLTKKTFCFISLCALFNRGANGPVYTSAVKASNGLWTLPLFISAYSGLPLLHWFWDCFPYIALTVKDQIFHGMVLQKKNISDTASTTIKKYVPHHLQYIICSLFMKLNFSKWQHWVYTCPVATSPVWVWLTITRDYQKCALKSKITTRLNFRHMYQTCLLPNSLH